MCVSLLFGLAFFVSGLYLTKRIFSRWPTANRNFTVDAAKAFQYLAAILISLILVLVLVAAFMSAPRTEKFGLVTGVSLAVYAVFQLIAFALMLAFANKGKKLMPASCSSHRVYTQRVLGCFSFCF